MLKKNMSPHSEHSKVTQLGKRSTRIEKREFWHVDKIINHLINNKKKL